MSDDLTKMKIETEFYPIKVQQAYLRRMYAQLRPCPNCGHPQNAFDAADVESEAWFNTQQHVYCCRKCKREMKIFVPFNLWVWKLIPTRSQTDER